MPYNKRIQPHNKSKWIRNKKGKNTKWIRCKKRAIKVKQEHSKRKYIHFNCVNICKIALEHDLKIIDNQIERLS